MAVDDVQWLDPPSAELLSYAARRLGDEPIRLLFAARTERTGGAGDGLQGAIEEARVERISLGPLPPSAIQHIFHEELGSGFPRPVLHRIHATSRGNPMHALELGRALARRGSDVDPGEPLPVSATLEDLVGERLAALPEATVRALEIAALSSEPTLALLEAALGEPPDLSPAVAAGVVTLEQDRLRFSHPLVSSGIAARMSGPTKGDVHRRLVDLGSDPEERAHHLALSVSEPDAGVAARLEAAARAARARGSPTASAEFLEHALRLSPRGDTGLVRRTVSTAEAQFESGHTTRALALLESLVSDLRPGAARGRSCIAWPPYTESSIPIWRPRSSSTKELWPNAHSNRRSKSGSAAISPGSRSSSRT